MKNQLLTIYLEDKIMNLLWVDFAWKILQDNKSIMLAEKTLLDYTNLFSPNDYKKNDKIIYKYFNTKYVKSWV